MENRRQDYRHAFPPPARIRAELASAAARPIRLVGEMADLSLGGMGLLVPGEAQPLAPAGPWSVQFSLRPETKPLWLTASLIHRRAEHEGICGFHFLPLADPVAQEDRERVLWRFLLEEQRKLRRERM